MIKIVVDLLGADKPQTELVLGAIRAISENKDLYVYLMGRKAELWASLSPTWILFT